MGERSLLDVARRQDIQASAARPRSLDASAHERQLLRAIPLARRRAFVRSGSVAIAASLGLSLVLLWLLPVGTANVLLPFGFVLPPLLAVCFTWAPLRATDDHSLDADPQAGCGEAVLILCAPIAVFALLGFVAGGIISLLGHYDRSDAVFNQIIFMGPAFIAWATATLILAGPIAPWLVSHWRGTGLLYPGPVRLLAERVWSSLAVVLAVPLVAYGLHWVLRLVANVRAVSFGF
jgi:hypothetical protein